MVAQQPHKAVLGLDRATVREYIAQADPKSPTPQTGDFAHSGPVNLCDPWREQIEKPLLGGLSVQRIYQDLVRGHGFNGSYHAVRRFVLHCQSVVELPYRRMECDAGQEVQVDFGKGAWVVVNGKPRKTHLLPCILSHSRKGYCEAVWRQTTESFIRCGRTPSATLAGCLRRSSSTT